MCLLMLSSELPYLFFAASAAASRCLHVCSHVGFDAISEASFFITSGASIFCGQARVHWPQPMQASARLSSGRAP